jgi:predicted phage terminase large subunit-like protein
MPVSDILSEIESLSTNELRRFLSEVGDPQIIDHVKSILEIRKLRKQKRQAVSSLLDFIKYTKDNYQVNWHHKIICDTLDEFLDPNSGLDRLIIEVGPRYGKSEICTRRFPAYALGKNPNLNIIIASYAVSLAKRLNRDVQRIIDDPKYIGIFPETRLISKEISRDDVRGNYSRTTEFFEIVNRTGSLRAAGVGTGITGTGADCFVKGTLITTDKGLIPIEEIVDNPSQFMVLSYNHGKGNTEFKRVIASKAQKSNKPIIEVQTLSGIGFRCTSDHRIFTRECGYIESKDLRTTSHTLIRIIPNRQEDLSILQYEQRKKFKSLLGLRQEHTKEDSSSSVFTMFQGLHKRFIRCFEGIEKKFNGFLLFKILFRDSSFNKKLCLNEMSYMWGSEESEKWWDKEILQRCVQNGRDKKKYWNPEKMSHMQGIIPRHKFKNCILFKVLCRFKTFTFNEGKWKFPSQAWKVLHDTVRENEEGNFREGRKFLSGMWFYGRYSDTSHRSQSISEQSHKSNNNVQDMSCCPSQVTQDTISKITTYSEKENIVYDIQVEGNSNFFANGILVHNCLIIDDPIKDWEQATSTTFKDALWDWYTSTAYTRLAKGGKVLIIQTRWAEDDLIGRVLEKAKKDPESDQFTVVSFPTEFDETHPHIHPLDPRTEEGEVLWPDFMSDSKVASTKKTVGSRVWASLYQQRPAPKDGNIVKGSWFKYYRSKPQVDFITSSWDFTFTASKTSDYVVGGVWGIKDANKYLLHIVRDKIGFTQSIAEMIKVANMYRDCNKVIVEAKANGPAIIDTLKGKISGIVGFIPDSSKEARANAVAPQIQAGNVWLPDPISFPEYKELIEIFVKEWTTFPNGSHDDCVDMTSQFLLDSNTQNLWLDQLANGDYRDDSEYLDKIKQIMGWI